MLPIPARYRAFHSDGLRLVLIFADVAGDRLRNVYESMRAFYAKRSEAMEPGSSKFALPIATVLVSSQPPHDFACPDGWHPIVEMMDRSKLVDVCHMASEISEASEGWYLDMNRGVPIAGAPGVSELVARLNEELQERGLGDGDARK